MENKEKERKCSVKLQALFIHKIKLFLKSLERFSRSYPMDQREFWA
jgi:hypothetical protein